MIPPAVWEAMNAITPIESGGKYHARGPKTRYGYAHGRYQVLEGNIGPWTKRALGRAFTTEEFRNDPEAQDLTTAYIMTVELVRLGNIADVIAVWHSGAPLAGNDRCDVNMCTRDYVAMAMRSITR